MKLFEILGASMKAKVITGVLVGTLAVGGTTVAIVNHQNQENAKQEAMQKAEKEAQRIAKEREESQKQVQEATESIEKMQAINVTTESIDALNAEIAKEEEYKKVKEKYDALTDEQKKEVKNSKKLTDNETALKTLKDKKTAAEAVINKINEIGKVDTNSQAKIAEARKAFDEFADKGLIQNAQSLVAAENTYAELTKPKEETKVVENKTTGNNSSQSSRQTVKNNSASSTRQTVKSNGGSSTRNTTRSNGGSSQAPTNNGGISQSAGNNGNSSSTVRTTDSGSKYIALPGKEDLARRLAEEDDRDHGIH